MEKIFCGECGHPNSAQNKFCNKCGHNLTVNMPNENSETVTRDKAPVSLLIKFQELENKLLGLIEHSGYLNVSCGDRYLQFLKYKNKRKLFVAVINIENIDHKSIKEIEALNFKPVEENLVRSFVIVSKNKAVKDVIEVVKSIFYKIYKVKQDENFHFEEFYGFYLENEKEEVVSKSVRDWQEEKDRKTNIQIGIIILGAFFLVFGYEYFINTPKSNPKREGYSTEASKEADEDNNTGIDSVTMVVGVGNVLKTAFFDITVNSAHKTNSVATTNEFGSLKEEDGQVYITLDVTFTNTDSQGHTIYNGSIVINEDGKILNLDKPENLIGAGDGWGIFDESIDPTTSKRTKVVYKLSSDVKGEAYYYPGNAAKGELIDLGKIE